MNKKFFFILFIMLTIIVLETKIAFAFGCTRTTKKVYWNDKCSGDPVEWYDFGFDLWGGGGYICAIGASTTDYGHPDYWEWAQFDGKLCNNPEDNVVWRFMENNQWPGGGSEGQICKVRWDAFADPCKGGSWEGRWDTHENACVQCQGNLQIAKHLCTDGKREYPCIGPEKCNQQETEQKCKDYGGCTWSPTCEQACNPDYVSPSCDGKTPNTEFDNVCSFGDPKTRDKCGSDCKLVDTNICDSACDSLESCEGKSKDTVLEDICSFGNSKTKDKCCNEDTNICDEQCGADPECNDKKTGEVLANGACDNNCLFTFNCNLYDRGYPDLTTDPKQCEGFDYTYSSANQMRDYYNSDRKECKCNVAFDSWIENVSVYGRTSGDVFVRENQLINVSIKIKNLGTQQQQAWFAGLEFWKVEDYTNPWNNRSKRIDVYYNARDRTHGNLQGISNADCELSDDPNGNGFLDSDETIRVKCWAPASYFGVTSGNQRVMVWAHERDLSQDAANNGNAGETWWEDALSRAEPTDLPRGYTSPNNNVRVNITYPTPIENVTYPEIEVIKGSMVAVSWQLNLTGINLEGKVWHTNVHCFRPGTERATERSPGERLDPACKNIDFSKYETETCNATCEFCFTHYPDIPTPQYPSIPENINRVQDVYTVQFLVDTLGEYACRVDFAIERLHYLSDIFKIKVVGEPEGPYCVFEPQVFQAIGPFSVKLTAMLRKFGEGEMPNSIKIRCKEGESYIDTPVTNANASIICEYPKVETQTVFNASVFLDYPGFTSCHASILDFPPPPCEIVDFKLIGALSGTSTVSQNERIIANITGKYCDGKTATIKDAAGETKCTCTFVNDVCTNTNCFNAPREFKTYTYTAYTNPSKNASLTVTYGPGLNIVYENYENMMISWILLPQVPSKGDRMLLVMSAKDSTGNYLTPEKGFSPIYRIGGELTFSPFVFLPDLYSEIKAGLWAINITVPSTDKFSIHVYTVNKVKIMEGVIVPGTITLALKDKIFEPENGYLFTTFTSSTPANLTYRFWKPFDISPLGIEGKFTKADSVYEAEITGIPEASFFFEALAKTGARYGGKLLGFGLTPPSISLSVTPSLIQALLPIGSKHNSTLTLNNTGNVLIRGIKINASEEIKNATSITYNFESLEVGESRNVSLSFNVTRALNGLISIYYSDRVKTVPVSINLRTPAQLRISPSQIASSVVAGQAFEATFTVANDGSETLIVNDIIVSGIPNVTTDFPGTVLIQGSSSRSFKLQGTLFSTGEYSGTLSVDTNAGLNSIPVRITVTSPALICNNNRRCEPERGETISNCPGDCYCGDGQCEEGEDYTSCPSDCASPAKLSSNITALNSSLVLLKRRMDALKDLVSPSLRSLYDEILSLLNEAKDLYDGGEYTAAQQKLELAWSKYHELENAIRALEGGGAFPTIFIVAIVIVVFSGIILILFKFGYLSKLAFWKKEEEYYY